MPSRTSRYAPRAPYSAARRFPGSRAGRLVTALIALAAVACDGTVPRVATTLQKLDGDQQTVRVNTSLPIVPSVRVLDQDGQPMTGATVAFSVGEGGGSVAADSALTNTLGVATAGAWTLGTAAGPNGLSVSVEGLPAVTFHATGTPGTPATLTVAAGADQQGRVGEPVAVPPSARVVDAFGNPTPDIEVIFQMTAGGGQVQGDVQRTDAQGIATVGGWELGRQVGENRLTVSVAGGPSATVTAVAAAGPPAAMTKHKGDGQSAAVTTDVPQPPAVRVIDTFGNPVPGVAVSFSVAQGGGSVEPASVTTDAAGVAAATRWALGTQTGSHTVSASAAGLPPVTLTANATAGAPAAVAASAGQGQSATAGSAVDVSPAVRVSDAHGNPVSGTPVTFVVVSGEGTVFGATRQTGSNGVATVGGWILGPQAGTNTLEARVEGLTAAVFTATATPSSGGGGSDGSFSITLRVVSGITASQEAIFSEAAARWEAVITGDLASLPISLDANRCGTHPEINEIVDDLLIFASGTSIDGPSGVLGRAGPCLIRSDGLLPILGFMEFDADDLAVLEARGDLLTVILHEMGHVLGIGSVWDEMGLLLGKGTTDPRFTGAEGVAAFDAVGGTSYAGGKVPVENSGGSGTRDSHWRESVLDAELMTGFLNPGGLNPLSLLTIASLEDMGYEVDESEADPYAITSALKSPGAEAERIQLMELPVPRPGRVGRDGVIREPLQEPLQEPLPQPR